MRKSLIILGFILLIAGIVLGCYASQRNCLIAFITRGYMSFWTVIEIVGGLSGLVGIIIAFIGFVKKT